MAKLRRFVLAIDAMNRQIGLSLMWLTLVIALLLVMQAVARYVFHHPVVWGTDVTMFICGGFFLLLGAYCLLVDAHVNMDIVRSRLSLRAGAILDIITSIFLLAFAVVLFWYGLDIARQAIVGQQRLLAAWKPLLWPVRITIPIGAFLLILQWLAKLGHNFHIAVTGRDI